MRIINPKLKVVVRAAEWHNGCTVDVHVSSPEIPGSVLDTIINQRWVIFYSDPFFFFPLAE